MLEERWFWVKGQIDPLKNIIEVPEDVMCKPNTTPNMLFYISNLDSYISLDVGNTEITEKVKNDRIYTVNIPKEIEGFTYAPGEVFDVEGLKEGHWEPLIDDIKLKASKKEKLTVLENYLGPLECKEDWVFYITIFSRIPSLIYCNFKSNMGNMVDYRLSHKFK